MPDTDPRVPQAARAKAEALAVGPVGKVISRSLVEGGGHTGAYHFSALEITRAVLDAVGFDSLSADPVRQEVAELRELVAKYRACNIATEALADAKEHHHQRDTDVLCPQCEAESIPKGY